MKYTPENMPGMGDEETWGSISGSNDPRSTDDEWFDGLVEEAEKQVFNERIESGWWTDAGSILNTEDAQNIERLLIECIPCDDIVTVNRDAKFRALGEAFAEIVRKYVWPTNIASKNKRDRDVESLLNARKDALSDP